MPSKGRVVVREADRLINDKATFYPVRFRNIDKLCKRLIRISHPSVLPARREAATVWLWRIGTRELSASLFSLHP